MGPMSARNPDFTLTPVADVAGGPVPIRPASRSLRAAIFSGSMILLVGSGLVSAINLIYNIVLARSLGATGFGQAVSVYTLLMLLSAVTLSFQFVCSKFVAKNNSLAAKAAVYSVLHRRSWQAGALVGTTLAVASPAISRYLNLSDPMLIVILAVGTAFYIPLGVRRGMLQGMYNFRRLSINFILEVMVKLGATVALLALGFGVKGVIAAVSASVVAGYLWARPGPELKVAPQPGLPASFLEGLQAIVFFVGQVVINNVDILLVKHFYPPAEAGLKRSLRSRFPTERAERIRVAATSVCCHHGCVLSQRRAHYIRDVQEDRQRRVAATGFQRRHRCGHLLVPWQPAPGHHGAVGADATAAGLRVRPISSLAVPAVLGIGGGTSHGPSPKAAAAGRG